jgi:hypothetical protein
MLFARERNWTATGWSSYASTYESPLSVQRPTRGSTEMRPRKGQPIADAIRSAPPSLDVKSSLDFCFKISIKKGE